MSDQTTVVKNMVIKGVRDWHDNSMLPMLKGRTNRTDLLS